MPPSVTTRATNMASGNAPINPVSDITVSVAGNGERTSKFEIPIMIFSGLAFGLVVIGFGIREIMRDLSRVCDCIETVLTHLTQGKKGGRSRPAVAYDCSAPR